MGDLIAYFNRTCPEMEWETPGQWSDGRDRSIGNIFDDYLSQL